MRSQRTIRQVLASCAVGIGLLLVGCVSPRTYTFNGVPFPVPISATTAMESYYSGIENSIAKSDKQLPASLLIVLPSRLYARTHWIRVTGNRAALGEDQMQYLANSQVRDAQSVARCVQNSGVFKTVQIVDALPGTLDPSPREIGQPVDVVMKKLPSGEWGLGTATMGPCIPVVMPSGLKGAAFMNALILTIQDHVRNQQGSR